MEWQQSHDGTWRARGARGIGGQFVISRRQVDGGEIFDVHRLIPERQLRSYLGSATSLHKAMALAQSRHARMRTGDDWKKPPIARKNF